jgi:hypothetical protein
VLVFDSLIFSLTIYKAFQIGRGVRLLEVIVCDGEPNRPLSRGFDPNLPTQVPYISRTRYPVDLPKKDNDDSEQGTIHYQFGKYFNPSGTS